MARVRQRKPLYSSATFSEETGEVKEFVQGFREPDEPPYVKLYIDCVLTLKGLQKGLNPILLALLKRMTYANLNDVDGGQLLFINKPFKELVAKEISVSVKRVEQAITEFVKTGIIRRIQVGLYQVNPDIAGRGEWKDIQNIRATIDFKAQKIKAKIDVAGDQLTLNDLPDEKEERNGTDN